MEEYVSIHKIVSLIKQYQQSQVGIGLNSFGFGNIVEFGNTDNTGMTPTYPFVFVTPQNISYEENIVTAIQRLKGLGFRICAVEQTEGSTSLMDWAIQPEEKWALILGNEVEGVQDAALALCDAVIEIPQSGMKHSLNISVAAGIVFWEVYKRYR
jgi:hypothetical protein